MYRKYMKLKFYISLNEVTLCYVISEVCDSEYVVKWLAAPDCVNGVVQVSTWCPAWVMACNMLRRDQVFC
jgi:hypothetical protein